MSRLLYFLLALGLFAACSKTREEPPVYNDNLTIRGGDISFIPEIRKSGIKTRSRLGEIEDMVTTLKNQGMNVARLRVWNSPADPHSSLQEVAAFASELRKEGIQVWITIHYSDWWADPGKQNKPKAWTGIPFSALKDSVYSFTSLIMQKVNPEFIQIGNEINNGILWPDGHYSNLPKLKELLAAGIKAVRDHNKNTRIMMHYAGHDKALPFYQSIRDLDYDQIGLSYYPFWHGKSFDSLATNIRVLADTFGKDIIIAETAYPFTFDYSDKTNNVIGLPGQIHPDFPPTVQGQKAFLEKVRKTIADAPHGIGFCYWAPEWVAFDGPESSDGSSWENQALWGFDYKALPSIGIFNR